MSVSPSSVRRNERQRARRVLELHMTGVPVEAIAKNESSRLGTTAMRKLFPLEWLSRRRRTPEAS